MEKLSTMLPLGTHMPDFNLKGIDGRTYSKETFSGTKGLLVMFICNHCPVVQHVNEGLIKMANELLSKNIGVLAVNSNDTTQEKYAEDRFDKMIEYSDRLGYTFPYTIDPDQTVAKSFTAQCTPDFFMFDENNNLVYRGQMDSSRPGNGLPVTGEDIIKAANALINGDPPVENQMPSAGCNIKWIPGQEPDYF